MKNKLLKRIAVILIIIIAILLSYRYIVEAKVITLPNGLAANLSNRKKTIEEYLNKNEEKALGDSVWVIRNTAPDAGWTSLSAANKRKVLLFTGISEFNTYCLDHAKYLNPQAFTIKGYVKIVGDKAMGYRFVDNNVVKKPKDKEYIQDDANLVLARILHDGSYAKGWSATGKRQLGLWRYMADTWMDKVGSSIIPSSFKHEYVRISSKETQSEWNNKKNIANSMITEMSKNLQNYMPSEIINEGGIANVENISGGTIAGPFKVAYKGTIGGIHVLDVNENEIDSSNITILKEDKTTEISSAKKIQSGENFYIKNTSNNSMGSLLINMKRSTIITARLWFLRGSNTQDILKVMTSEEKEDQVSLKIAIGINRGIIIEKTDSNDSNSKIEGAEFIIKDKEKGWIYEKIEENKITYDYTENSSEAKRFTTEKNGIVKIDNLPTAVYQIYEVSAPYGYKLSEQNNYDPNNDWVVIKNSAVIRETGAIISNDDNNINIEDNENQELRITKTVGANLNNKISYKITVTNNSNSIKRNLEVVDENVDNIAQLNGKNKVGEILTASLSVPYDSNYVSYKWFRTTIDSEGNVEEYIIENENQSTYEIKQSDVNSSIGVTIKINNTANVSTEYKVKTEIIKDTENAEDIVVYKNEVKAIINMIEAGNYEEIFFNHTITDDDDETGSVLNVATLVEKVVSTNENGNEVITERTYTSNETSTSVELIKLVQTIEANNNGVTTYKVNITNNSNSIKRNLEITTDESIDNIAELSVSGKVLTAVLPENYTGNVESYEWLRVKTDSEGNEIEEPIVNNNSTYEINSDDINSYIVATIKVNNNSNYSTLYTVQTDIIKDENASNLMTYKTNATILINEIGVGNSVDVYYQHTQSNSGNNSGNENNQGNNEQNNQENNVVTLEENDILLSDNDVVLRLKITNKNFKGNLKIIKKDGDTERALSGAKFIVKRVEKNGQGNVTTEKWINLEEGKYKYVDSSDSAYKFTTDANGIIDLKDLEAGIYKVYETAAPEGYKLEIQAGYDSSKNWVDFNKELEVIADQTKTMEATITNFQAGLLKVIKKDGNTKLEAGFKIYSADKNGWLSGKTKDEYKYDNTFENAEVYYNKKENNYLLTLDKLRFGKYQIYEVVPPEGYDLKLQEGYDSNRNWVYAGEVSLNANNMEATVTKENAKGVSISGFVWIDIKHGKDNDYNSMFDEFEDVYGVKEKRVKGVLVNLKNKNTGEIVAYTNTDDDGKYSFNGMLLRSQLENYYVEFDYRLKNNKIVTSVDGGKEIDISKYIPVRIDTTKGNGSKAIMSKVAEKDVDLSGIATTYTGTDSEGISKYGLGAIGTENTGTSSIDNINLGIKEIPSTPFVVNEDLASVKIGIKGYNYTYIYGQEGDRNQAAAPTVRWQNRDAYTRKIYPSDIIYQSNNAAEMLSVNVTYNIDITNTTAINIKELYQENSLVISSLTNTYDAKRYTLNDSNWDAPTKTEGETATATYKGNKLTNGIAPNSSSPTIQITFSVNRDALLEILKGPEDGIGESYPTKATAIGYHKYSRTDYSWENNIIKDQEHITKDYTVVDDAPYLVFQLGEERTISGKVFEDNATNTTNGQKLGDGQYNEGENIIKNVKVELLDVIVGENGKETVQTSHLYTKTEAGIKYAFNEPNAEGTKYPEDAVVFTGDDGRYTLAGLVPGIYYIRYTYGDGTQKIGKLNGGTFEEIATVTAKDYKSTIVTDEIAKDVLMGNSNDLEWYKKLKTSDASVAIDSMNSRIAVNEENEQYILAGTAKVSITVENTESNTLVITNDNMSSKFNVFGGINFGIIEQPKQNAEIEKIITHLKLTNAQNEPIFSGNPETAQMVGVSDLDGKTNGGSSYVRVELAEESIYGSNIEITYQVKITNTSDLNYYNKEYYYYGDPKDKSKEVLLQPIDVTDYLHESLTYLEDKTKVLNGEQDRVTDTKSKETITINGKDIKNAQEFKLTGWKTLHTSKNTAATGDKSDKVMLVAERILSNQDDDMEIISGAKIKEAINAPAPGGDPNSDEFKTVRPATDSKPEASATLTITPPTGEDRNIIIIYAIAGIMSLVLLATGIVVIKKRIV